MYYPRTIMQRHNSQDEDIVNGSIIDMNALRGPGNQSQVVPDRHPATVKRQDKLEFGTWNVRTLAQAGKLENVMREMDAMKLDLLGMSEVRREGVGRFIQDDKELFWSGGSSQERGVGFLLKKHIARCVIGYWAISDRVMILKVKGSPFNINFIQVYAPTSASSNEELEVFYEQVEKAKGQCKSQEIVITMGDLNAKVGSTADEVVGPFGLGERNERGDRWVEWCKENNLIIANTYYRHHPRFLWTWKSPGDIVRNQIDYIAISRRFRNAVIQCKTKPSADCNSDHVPVTASFKVKLKKLKKEKPKKQLEYGLLRNRDLQEKYSIEVKNRYEALQVDDGGDGESDNAIEMEWIRLQTALTEAASGLIPEIKRKARKKWMTDEILKDMDERKECKDQDEDKYKRIDKQIKRKCNKAKEEWIDKECEELQRLEKKNSRAMHEKVRELSGKKKVEKGSTIRKEDGNIAMEIDEVLKRWEEYVTELFKDDSRGEKPEITKKIEGPPILKEEIAAAMKKMKNRKSPGTDGIMIEMLNATEEFAIEKITKLANKIYNTGYIPEEMKKSVFVVLPKKPGTVECTEHRTISLMSQVTKIILRVLLNRARNKIKEVVSEVQYGFGSGKGTRNAIFVTRMISERAIEMQRDLFKCFVDYSKAFDCLQHEDLVEELDEIGLDTKDIRLIRNLYWDQKATVKIDNHLSKWIQICRGVRQGCVLSPDLFALYGENIMKALEDLVGVKVGGVNINNLRYVDDAVIIAESEEQLQQLMNVVEEESAKKGLKINMKKTETMVVTKKKEVPKCTIKLGGEELKQVKRFKYLGSIITEDGRSTSDIIQRINIARSNFNALKIILTNKKISKKTRLNLICTYVWSSLLYGAESWTISKEMERRISAAELWFYRRMLKVSWTKHVSNEEILRRVGNPVRLMDVIRNRQLRFLGHVIRKDGVEKLALTGKIEGKRDRGRQRLKYLDQFGAKSNTEFIHSAQEREDWRSMIRQRPPRDSPPW